MSTTVTAEQFLATSIELATANVLNSGGPFGAVIVTADGQAFHGVNRVTASNDPTAHAEVTAIRNACSELGTFDLSGATLYTSCEPCPMCLASALWARIDRVFFAADRHDAASVGGPLHHVRGRHHESSRPRSRVARRRHRMDEYGDAGGDAGADEAA